MQNSMKVTAAVLFSLALTACGTSHSDSETQNPKNPGQQGKENLSGRTLQEVLDLKYDKAVFTCKLWSQAGTTHVNLNAKPDDIASWDLKKDLTAPKLSLAVHTSNRTLNIDMSVEKVELLGSLVLTTSSKTYEIKHSPKVTVSYSYTGKTNWGSGAVSTDEGGGSSDTVEKVPNAIIDETSAWSGSNLSISTYLECQLDTEIKPQYQDEFKAR